MTILVHYVAIKPTSIQHLVIENGHHIQYLYVHNLTAETVHLLLEPVDITRPHTVPLRTIYSSAPYTTVDHDNIITEIICKSTDS